MGFGGIGQPFGPLGSGSGGPTPLPPAPRYFWQPEPGSTVLGMYSDEPPITKAENEMLWANKVTVDKRVNVGPGVTKFVRVGIWFAVRGTSTSDFNEAVNGSSVIRLINFGTRIQPIEGMRR